MLRYIHNLTHDHRHIGIYLVFLSKVETFYMTNICINQISLEKSEKLRHIDYRYLYTDG